MLFFGYFSKKIGDAVAASGKGEEMAKANDIQPADAVTAASETNVGKSGEREYRRGLSLVKSAITAASEDGSFRTIVCNEINKDKLDKLSVSLESLGYRSFTYYEVKSMDSSYGTTYSGRSCISIRWGKVTPDEKYDGYWG